MFYWNITLSLACHSFFVTLFSVYVTLHLVFQMLSCLLCTFYLALFSPQFAQKFQTLSCLPCAFYFVPTYVKFAHEFLTLFHRPCESQVKKCWLESIKEKEREKRQYIWQYICSQPVRVLRQEGRQRCVSLTIGTWRRLGTGSPHIQGSLLLRNTVEPTLTDILYSGYLIILDKMLRSRLKLHYA